MTLEHELEIRKRHKECLSKEKLEESPWPCDAAVLLIELDKLRRLSEQTRNA